MELIEAVKARHSVRKYTDRPIETGTAATLKAAIENINAQAGLNIQLVLEEPKAFSTGMWKYGQFSGVKNYFVMAGPKGREAEEKLGYFGEQLVLLAPTAVNQQKFKFILHPGNVVEARTSFSMTGYVNMDLGIVKYHFELGAGKENFTWK